MCNDSTYWLTFSVLITGAFGFIVGRLFERADRWLKDWDAERRAVKAVKKANEARLTLAGPNGHQAPKKRRFDLLRRGLADYSARPVEAQLWR